MTISAGQAVFGRELSQIRTSAAFLANYSAYIAWAISHVLNAESERLLDTVLLSQYQSMVVLPTVDAATPSGYSTEQAQAYFENSYLQDDISTVIKAIREYARAKGLSKRALRGLLRNSLGLDSRVLTRIPDELLAFTGKGAPKLKYPNFPFAEVGMTYQDRIEATSRTIATGLEGWRVRQEAERNGEDLRWVTVQDNRVRPAHVHAQGQTVPYDEPFSVGGYPMWFPGDPSAPEDLTVNCRCVLSSVAPPNRRWVQRYVPPAWLEASSHLGAMAPAQARAPKGTSIGGQWIDTPTAILRSLNRLEVGTDLGPRGAPDDIAAAKAERRQAAADVLAAEGRPSLDETADRISMIYDRTTPEQRAAGEVWYEEARGLAQEMAANPATDLTEEQAAAIIAHLSTQTRWEANADYARSMANGLTQDQALEHLKAEIAAGRIVKAGKGGDYVMDRNWQKALDASHSSDPIGRGNHTLGTFTEPNKTRTFASNILGDGDGVTIDSHMEDILGQKIKPTGSRLVNGKVLSQKLREDMVYESLAEATRIAADRAGITPAQMQAITWGWGLAHRVDSRKGHPARLVDGDLTIPIQIGGEQALIDSGDLAAAAMLDPDPLDPEPMPDYWYAQATGLLGLPREEAPELDPRFGDNDALTAADGTTPRQARAPKGTEIGGQWIDSPSGILAGIEDPDNPRMARRLGGQGEPLSFQDAAADPQALRENVNPAGYKTNCQRVSYAIEMQARGYPNAVAPEKPGNSGATMIEAETKFTPDPATGRHREFQPLMKDWATDTAGDPVGARYLITGQVKRGGGHMWNAEKQADGTLLHIDGQVGAGAQLDRMTDLFGIMRVDDLDPSFTALAGSTEPGGDTAWVTSRQKLATSVGVTDGTD